jgi:hypothetical protein
MQAARQCFADSLVAICGVATSAIAHRRFAGFVTQILLEQMVLVVASFQRQGSWLPW